MQTSRSPHRYRLAALLAALAVAGCATVPAGPGVMALPGSGKSFEQFRNDDLYCRQYATSLSGGQSTEQAQVDETVRGAVIGTALGAVAGAALGGSRGARMGAGTGLVLGAASGASASPQAGWPVQQRYDHAYVQCMYAAGHKVPLPAGLTEQRLMAPPATSGFAAPPPPPPGPPPAPPPGVLAPR